MIPTHFIYIYIYIPQSYSFSRHVTLRINELITSSSIFYITIFFSAFLTFLFLLLFLFAFVMMHICVTKGFS